MYRRIRFCFMPRFSTFVAALQKIPPQLVNGSFSTVSIALVSSPFFGEQSYVFWVLDAL